MQTKEMKTSRPNPDIINLSNPFKRSSGPAEGRRGYVGLNLSCSE
jgi:hypothetical protein